MTTHIAADDNIFAGSGSDNDNEGGYKPRPQLPQPNVNMRSLANLIKELDSAVIDVDPEYQREIVWTAEQNYYIPPIILNKKRSAGTDGSTPRDTLVCVDGKQRLSSIRAFVKGMIPCHDHEGERWWFCKTPGTKHKRVLPLEAQKMFLEKDFVAFQFTDLTQEQEEDLFARVQMGVQLTVAEKMRAKQGPWQELAKLFVDDFPAICGLMKDRARAKDFQITLSCFSQIIEVKHPTAANGLPVLKTNYNALPKLLSNTGAVDDAIKSHLASVWTTLRELIERDSDAFTNADKHLGGVQTFAPIEMVAATVLISMYSETRNNELLLGDIRTLREALREQFKDLRLNATVWKFVWDFVENLAAIRGAVDGTTVDRNQQDQASKSMSSGAAKATANVSSPPCLSRKRATSAKKQVSTLPPRSPVEVKKEPQSRIATSKRKRTGPAPASLAPASAFGFMHGNLNGSHITDANIVSSAPTRTAAAIMKTAASNCQRLRQEPQVTIPLIPDLSNVAPQAYHQHHIPPTQLQDPQKFNVHTPFTTEPEDLQVLQTGISGSSDYCTPIAPMQQSTQLCSIPRHIPEVAQCSHNAFAISQSPNMISCHPTSRSAFAPTHTDKQWEGVVASPAKAPVAPISNKRKRKSVTRPTPAQYKEAIDLTSDNELEEERQNLLSSFKAKPIPAKQPSAPTTPAAKASTAPTRRDYVVVHDIDSDEELAAANNPYERFQNNPRAGLSSSRGG
ncbi:unnamed protein product [Alternaria alternata]